MSIELKPLGNKCNIACTYCYQKYMREDEKPAPYNIELMLKAADNALIGAKKKTKHFAMYGGEPLLVPIKDLEIFFKYGYQKYGHNGIQTNGTLITDDHIALFKKYAVSVGISIDGPGSLNDARKIGTEENTRTCTRKTEENLIKLMNNGITPSLIVTLHRKNYEKLDVFLLWMRYLEKNGIKHIRLHFLENDDADELVLKEEELIDFCLMILKLNSRIRFDLFDDIQKLLLYDSEELEEVGQVGCVWNACDPYTTQAVQGIKGDGSLGNCGRTNKRGIDYLKADSRGQERYWALFQTPEEYKGCKGCRFFYACKGHCPGEGEQKDWRNRTEHCGTLKAIFAEFESRIEAIGKIPISKDKERREVLEKALLGGDFNSSGHADIPHGDGYEFEVPVEEPQ